MTEITLKEQNPGASCIIIYELMIVVNSYVVGYKRLLYNFTIFYQIG